MKTLLKPSIELCIPCLIGVLLLAGCRKPEPKPVDIGPDDMCAMCKMAISQTRYAAELIDPDGETLKFDDLACLAQYLRAQPAKQAICFVVDYDTRNWVKAADACYVRSSDIQTPMGGGILAFQDPLKAKAAATQHHGQLLRFTDLIGLTASPTRGSEGQ